MLNRCCCKFFKLGSLCKEITRGYIHGIEYNNNNNIIYYSERVTDKYRAASPCRRPAGRFERRKNNNNKKKYNIRIYIIILFKRFSLSFFGGYFFSSPKPQTAASPPFWLNVLSQKRILPHCYAANGKLNSNTHYNSIRVVLRL